MKKHDEGYVMLLVVVVILVLSIVSAALMSMTVVNLKNQRNSVNRMQEKYSAQGELEKQVATVTANLEENSNLEILVDPANSESGEPGPKDAIKKWITENLLLTSDIGEITVVEERFTWSIPLTAISESENTQISCTLELTGAVKEKKEEPSADENGEEKKEPSLSKTFIVTFSQWKYASYTILEGGGGE